METAEVIVIGTGAVGSSAMWHLARRGVDTLGLDRFEPGHDKGSSHGQTRIIRLAYHEHPNYVPILLRSYEMWKALENDSEQDLYRETGLIQIGLPDQGILKGVKLSADLHNLPIQKLNNHDIMDIYPGLNIPDNMEGVFENKAGFLRVEKCIKTQLKLATRARARLISGVSVYGWKPEGDGVVVQTSEGSKWADKLVITAGSWSGDLLPHLSTQMSVVRKPLFWYHGNDFYDVESGFPTFIFDTHEGEFYGFPSINDLGVKVAEHTGGDPVSDLMELDRTLDPKDKIKIDHFLQVYLPNIDTAKLSDHAVCMYTRTPDGNFIVGRDPRYPQVSYVCGLSGHGFKMSIGLGEILADFATDQVPYMDVDFLSPARFQSGFS